MHATLGRTGSFTLACLVIALPGAGIGVVVLYAASRRFGSGRLSRWFEDAIADSARVLQVLSRTLAGKRS